MNLKKTIYRMDFSTRKVYPRKDLFRLVKTEEGLVLDKEDKLPGRGIYLLKDEETVKRVSEKKMLRRFTSSDEDILRLSKELMNALRESDSKVG